MNGVTIINTVQNCNTSLIGLVVCYGIALSFVIGFFILLFNSGFRSAYPALIFALCFAFLGLALCIWGNPGLTNQYQVILDDSVSMNEFCQHYRIIRQEGISYIVEEIVP